MPTDNSDFRLCACYNIRKTSRVITQFYDDALKPVSLKATQFGVLAGLANTRKIMINALAEVMGMDRTTVTRALVRLEKEGLVVSSSGNDARERYIDLTEAGFTKLDEARPHWEKAQAVIEQGLGENFKKTLELLKETSEVVKAQ